MSSKRLHLHSLPHFVAAMGISGALAVAVMVMQGDAFLAALMRPSLKVQPAVGGTAKLAPNTQSAAEAPGAFNTVDATMQAGELGSAAESMVLQLSLDQAIDKR